MKNDIISDLSIAVPVELAADIVNAFEELVSKHRGGDLEGALTKGGRFVEHVLRMIEFLRTGTAPVEIKRLAKTVQEVENDTALPESLRLLIPRIAYGMIYNIRSKRDAVHVKEIDPTPIDVSLMVVAAGWILAELLRLYHKSDARAVADAMLALTRGSIPLVEAINGEVFVGQNVPAKNEILLLLAQAKPRGVSRTALGASAKCSQPSVSRALKELIEKRMVHLSVDSLYFITGAGEQALDQWLMEKK